MFNYLIDLISSQKDLKKLKAAKLQNELNLFIIRTENIKNVYRI